MKKSKNSAELKERFFPVIAFLLLLVIWELVTYFFNISRFILPRPSEIIKSFWQSFGLIWYHSGRSVLEAVFGLIFGSLLGIIIAFLMDMSNIGRKIILPVTVVSQTIPIIALAPLMVIWFGYGIFAKILIIALICFFPVAIALYQSFSAFDRNYLRLLRSLNANSLEIYIHGKIPASLVGFYSGIRIAASYALITAVVSEWIGADRGLGILLIRSSKSYLTERVFAVIAVISLITLLMIRIIDILAVRFIPWNFKKV